MAVENSSRDGGWRGIEPRQTSPTRVGGELSFWQVVAIYVHGCIAARAGY
jgi:hypothetical protein